MYKIMLDSGAWSAYTQGKEIPIDEYMQFIYDNKDCIDHYVNLDVIGDGRASLNNYRIMKDNGLDPIPVFHAGTSVRFLYKYLEYTDYVAIGAIAKMHTKSRISNLDKYVWPKIVDRRGYPIAKFHGFGLTSLKIMSYYPWYSVDSSSWVQYGRYGIILVPYWRDNKWDYTGEPLKIIISSRKENQPKHFINMPDGMQKDMILRYFEETGFDYKTLSTHHISRDKINLVYYLGIQDQVLAIWPRRYIMWKKFTEYYMEIMDTVKRDKVQEKKDRKDDNVIYIAGNFPVMKEIKEERAIKEQYPTRYNRLISYFFKDDIQVVLQLKREEINGTK